MVTSIEEFRRRACEEVELPGFNEGETVTVELRRVSILSLVATGRVPNTLMNSVTKVFSNPSDKPEGTMKQASDDNIKDMVKLLDAVAESALVNPRYEDIKDYLTDDQKNAIFDYTQRGVKMAQPFSRE